MLNLRHAFASLSEALFLDKAIYLATGNQAFDSPCGRLTLAFLGLAQVVRCKPLR